ncbi:hypothetical protein ROJ8625_03981 [Roseivivax jejudonensis]|uniref:Uncharacterized protein n=1 Tax=Roseivivax jejudonensis TaxID=1529041 RepID=A0A1X7A9A8_9RHOB|nr:hypothetical protein [Roseivivax jejudonensis]SLN73763.1 hypothetical protein ROJ8625_03981 [Roseivivax jejudonensis]
MRRNVIIASGLLFAAAASVTATQALTPSEPEVIEIEVSADELQECRETLAQVAQMPAVTDSGSPLLLGVSEDLPSVRCVATEA